MKDEKSLTIIGVCIICLVQFCQSHPYNITPMESKRLTYIGILVGGALGGYLPTLWGADYFSFQTILGNGVGAIFGIWVIFKLTH
jgi:hypothetical protein